MIKILSFFHKFLILSWDIVLDCAGGDNILAEFTSVVDAVQRAVEIQNILKAKNEDLPENRRIIFRIGVNLGDVIQEGDRIYGEGDTLGPPSPTLVHMDSCLVLFTYG